MSCLRCHVYSKHCTGTSAHVEPANSSDSAALTWQTDKAMTHICYLCLLSARHRTSAAQTAGLLLVAVENFPLTRVKSARITLSPGSSTHRPLDPTGPRPGSHWDRGVLFLCRHNSGVCVLASGATAAHRRGFVVVVRWRADPDAEASAERSGRRQTHRGRARREPHSQRFSRRSVQPINNEKHRIK